MDAEVPVHFVTQVSGHKNLKDLVSYKAASVEHQQKMSYISQADNPNALFRMCSGAFIGKIEGCFFTGGFVTYESCVFE